MVKYDFDTEIGVYKTKIHQQIKCITETRLQLYFCLVNYTCIIYFIHIYFCRHKYKNLIVSKSNEKKKKKNLISHILYCILFVKLKMKLERYFEKKLMTFKRKTVQLSIGIFVFNKNSHTINIIN